MTGDDLSSVKVGRFRRRAAGGYNLHRQRPQIAFPKKQSTLSLIFIKQQLSIANSQVAAKAWEIRWQLQTRPARRKITKGDQLSDARRQRQPRAPRKEIMKGDKLGRQAGNGNQEQHRREIMNGDKLGIQGGSGSQE